MSFLVNFFISTIVSLAVSVVLGFFQKVPSPEAPPPASLDAFNFPTAQVGREFPVLFGHKDMPSQNIVWFGDLSVTPVTRSEKVSTGLFSSETVTTTINYKYSLGMHMVLAHEIELITQIITDGKVAWSGYATDTISVNSPELFGGETRGGGLAGTIQILKGLPSQMPNAYLQSQLGADIPAFRGVATLVFPGFYWGTSTRIYPLNIRCKNIYRNWYPTKAEIGSGGDMNPAHIIYNTLTNKRWGMAYNSSDIDETSFIAAADTLYAEGFGLSMLWDKSARIEDFITEVLKHIDAVLYMDIHTGKFKLKLIRGGYDKNSLPVFDETNIIEVEKFKRRTMEDIANSITVQYWDRTANKEGSFTYADIALVAQMGGTNNVTMSFPGISTPSLAGYVLSRELRSLSSPLASGTILTTREGAALSPGDPFILSWPRYGITEIVVRVTTIEYGEFGESAIRVNFLEDIFSIDDTIYSIPPPTFWVNPVRDPAPCPVHVFMEAPYHVVARKLGSDNVARLSDTVGLSSIAGTPPDPTTLEADFYFRGIIYRIIRKKTALLAPHAMLTSDAGIMDTSLHVSWQYGLDNDRLFAGDWGIIDNEIIRIDDFSNPSVLVVGRGCLDTVPAKHSANAHIIPLGNFLVLNYVTSLSFYDDGDTAYAKICPRTGKGTLALDDAPEQSVVMNSRLIRPYPPARLRINGIADIEAQSEFFGTLNLAWKHRDRIKQLEVDIYDTEDDISVGPEIGTTYTIEIHRQDTGAKLYEKTGLAGESETILNTEINYEGQVYLLLWAIRDTYDSWQKHNRSFLYFRTELCCTEAGELRITEAGEYRILE